jgi:hypothetical protein
MAEATLEERVATLEQLVAYLLQTTAQGERSNDWRHTVGMFDGNPIMQEIIAEHIRYQGGDYLLALKSNHKKAYAAVKAHFHAHIEHQGPGAQPRTSLMPSMTRTAEPYGGESGSSRSPRFCQVISWVSCFEAYVSMLKRPQKRLREDHGGARLATSSLFACLFFDHLPQFRLIGLRFLKTNLP